MTQRLYYDDTNLRKFSARVLETRSISRETGALPAVRLDQTVFYPTSGGQPHDTGLLNNIPVIDVWDDDAGHIWHLLEHSLIQTEVTGEIDWSRRFDHMQQHTGQHLLSAAFIETFNAATVGFHLGTTASTIDLDIPDLTWRMIAEVEQAANHIIFENRPVSVQYATQQDLQDIPLRKPPQVTGKIRIVWIKDYDASACGGTHVSRTGQIGIIKITAIEHYKGGTRVSFLCGQRALQDYTRGAEILRSLGLELTVGQDELYDAVIRIEDEAQKLRRALNKAQKELVQFRAEQLWRQSPDVDGIRRITHHWKDLAFAEARAIASRLQQRPHTLLLLAVTEEKSVRVVCARSDDLTEIDASELLRAIVGALGGRGGGSPSIAQGGAPHASPEAIQEALKAAASL